MLAIDDFGRPRRRASSLGPAARLPFSARTSRINAARVTAGASDSLSRRAPSAPTPSVLKAPPRARVSPPRANMLNRVPYLDSGYKGCSYCPTYRHLFNMLDDGRDEDEEDPTWCRASDWSRRRTARS